MRMGSSSSASGADTARPTEYCTRLAVSGCVSLPWRFSHRVPATMDSSASTANSRPAADAVPIDDFARITSAAPARSEEHTSELQSLMRISYAVFCLKKKKNQTHDTYVVYPYTDQKAKD